MTDSLEVVRFPCLQDNYGYLVRDTATGTTATVDTPEVAPILAALDERGWQLDFILNTHHHWDHAGGNLELKERTGCTIVGPAADRQRIPGIDIALADGDAFQLGESEAVVLDTPGHTHGHICFYFADAGKAFVGDTLFALGCGRVFEGTMPQMWDSLSKLRALPDSTLVYCAHEYTLGNARFAVTVDPENPDLAARAAEIEDLRERGEPTVPSVMGVEKACNPFLRADSESLREHLDMRDASDADVFAHVRELKDNF